MAFTIQPLSSAIGAEAVGFDPRNFTDADRDALQQSKVRRTTGASVAGVVGAVVLVPPAHSPALR